MCRTLYLGPSLPLLWSCSWRIFSISLSDSSISLFLLSSISFCSSRLAWRARRASSASLNSFSLCLHVHSNIQARCAQSHTLHVYQWLLEFVKEVGGVRVWESRALCTQCLYKWSLGVDTCIHNPSTPHPLHKPPNYKWWLLISYII